MKKKTTFLFLSVIHVRLVRQTLPTTKTLGRIFFLMTVNLRALKDIIKSVGGSHGMRDRLHDM